MAGLRSRQLRAGHLALATVRPTLPRCVSPPGGQRSIALHTGNAPRGHYSENLLAHLMCSRRLASPFLPAAGPRSSLRFPIEGRLTRRPLSAPITNRGPTSARLRLERLRSTPSPRSTLRTKPTKRQKNPVQHASMARAAAPRDHRGFKNGLDHLHAIAIGWAFRDVATP